MDNQLSRRQLLTGALQVGIGAVVLPAAGVLGQSVLDRAAAAPPAVSPPGEPPNYRTYVSRPDLRPPGVTISQVPGSGSRPGEPRYVMLAPRVTVGGTYPAGAQPGLMILDRFGDVVWFKPMTGAGMDPLNFRVQTYGGKPVLTWFQGTVGPTGLTTSGEYVLADSSYNPITTVTANEYPSDLHEFLLTPEGTALLTAYETDTTSKLVIGHAQEVDVATNDLVFDWPCYPAVPTSATYNANPTGDYFHMNSIDLWPGPERNLLISGRDTSAVYLVSRATKRVIWQAGGRTSSFQMTGPGTRFSYQHDARALLDGSGFSLFDDASPPSPEKQSWGKVLDVNQTSKKISLRHQYKHTPFPILTGSQGNCQLLPTGGHLVGWGANPYFTEFAPSGTGVESQIILDGRLPVGAESYRTFMSYWSATPPASELALAVRQRAGGSFTAYISWNGATEIATWRISAGRSAQSLSHVVTLPKGSFESVASFAASGATAFEATAYDAKGARLGSSSVVEAT
jgi:hypothetical protein